MDERPTHPPLPTMATATMALPTVAQFPCVCLSACVIMSVYLLVLSVCRYGCVSVCLPVCLSVTRSVGWSVCLYVCVGCTPLNTVPILSCVKANSKNCHFRVFIMIKIGQTLFFLKDCVHIHQIGSHFVGGYRLDFSPGGQETRRSFFKLLALGSPRLL